MVKKGGKAHLKRLLAPHFWRMPKKEAVWAARPTPGPHSKDASIPLVVILRYILNYAYTAKEARRIITEGRIEVDGKVRRNPRFSVGLMDVVEIPETKDSFRILPAPKRGLVLHPIKKSETNFKLCRIENKTCVKGGHIQLNLHDGRNYLIKLTDPHNPTEDIYKVHEVIVLSLPKQGVKDHIKTEEGVVALTIAGKNLGLVGKIEKIERGSASYPSIVTLKGNDDTSFQTLLKYVFPIGAEKPLISIPEAST
ncbi:MAG: 30S ribosomal protein S4e [Promethearchaeota archaeon]